MTILAASNTGLKPVPVKKGLPILGHSIAWIRRADQLVFSLHKEFGDVVRVPIFGTEVVFLMNADGNQLLLQNRDQLFESSIWEYFIGPFFHRGIMLLDGKEHRMHRRIMQSAFSKPALQSYLLNMQPRIADDLAEWRPSDTFPMFQHLKRMTLNIGSEVFIGHAPGPAAEKMNTAFLDTVQAGTGLIRFGLLGTRWHKGLKGRAFLENFFRGEIAEKRANPGEDLFSRLCEARSEDGELFSDEDVINHIIFVLMAAHDTSTIALCNMLYHTAKNQQWQERLRAQSLKLGSSELSYEQLSELSDIDLVMKEALRMCPPVPMFPRRLTKDIEFEGHQIKAGSTVTGSSWLIHHMEKHWTNPMAFDPDRFGPERAEDRKHPFQWIPFGGGAHKCIGLHFGEMEVKSILHRMLLQFRWSVPDGYVMEQDFTSLPIPKDGLPLKLERLQ